MCGKHQPGAGQGIVISDLHLFARRSRGMERFDSLRSNLEDAALLVLNGDIFDFRWSTLGRLDRSVPAAVDWLCDLANDFPNCEIHYVVGNHDCTTAFLRELCRLAAGLPRFKWHEYFLRLGPSLFFHGDFAHRRMDHLGLRRFRGKWQGDWRCGDVLSTVYGCVDRLGITRRVHEWHFPRYKTVKRITFYLDQTNPGWRMKTRHCYFGHTHLPFMNYEFEGIRFHNTGSAIFNLDFNPILFGLPGEEVGSPNSGESKGS